LLGRHVGNGSDNRALLGHGQGSRSGVGKGGAQGRGWVRFRQAEIEQLGARLCQDDVAGLRSR
jgi:hypothetical protein